MIDRFRSKAILMTGGKEEIVDGEEESETEEGEDKTFFDKGWSWNNVRQRLYDAMEVVFWLIPSLFLPTVVVETINLFAPDKGYDRTLYHWAVLLVFLANAVAFTAGFYGFLARKSKKLSPLGKKKKEEGTEEERRSLLRDIRVAHRPPVTIDSRRKSRWKRPGSTAAHYVGDAIQSRFHSSSPFVS